MIKNKTWFVHLGYSPPLPLKLEIKPDHSAKVIGGTSGTHATGHGENYWDKIAEVIRLGYMPVSAAQDLGCLPLDWSPPNEDELDYQIKEGFYSMVK